MSTQRRNVDTIEQLTVAREQLSRAEFKARTIGWHVEDHAKLATRQLDALMHHTLADFTRRQKEILAGFEMAIIAELVTMYPVENGQER